MAATDQRNAMPKQPPTSGEQHCHTGTAQHVHDKDATRNASNLRVQAWKTVALGERGTRSADPFVLLAGWTAARCPLPALLQLIMSIPHQPQQQQQAAAMTAGMTSPVHAHMAG